MHACMVPTWAYDQQPRPTACQGSLPLHSHYGPVAHAGSMHVPIACTAAAVLQQAYAAAVGRHHALPCLMPLPSLCRSTAIPLRLCVSCWQRARMSTCKMGSQAG